MASKLLPINEGGADRAVRIIAGLVLISLAFVGPKTPWGYLGIIPLVTGFIGSCPLYTVFGINTCGTKQS
ncbi:MAG: DUF2892 domain-containing protein [Gemmatimonadetes bacterium]|nr:DUF2892 domain-containing protein [Gemmatimonadota bacterium]MBI3568589.1 DUF2892 domain-containing protein [Gemmatimonadota bacterium]